MKKFLFGAVVLFVLASCDKDDQTGIPPIDGGGYNPVMPTIEVVNASDIDDAYYTTNIGKKVAVKGNITVDGTRSFLKLKDNTPILIYAPTSVFNTLSDVTKDKLKINGQEVTVTGIFTDYKHPTTGVVTKEIVYSKEADLVFGTTPTPTTPVDVDSATSNLADVYAEGKLVKVTGKIIYENTRSWIAFKDGEKVQLYIQGFTSLAQDIKDKLATTGQGVVITGKFVTYNTIKQLQIQNGATDITFTGTTPVVTVTNLETTTATVSDYADAKNVKLHGVIVIDGDKPYFKLSDNTMILIYAPNAVVNGLSQGAKDKLKIAGQELTVNGVFTTYGNVRQIVYSKEGDLVFGTTSTPNPNPSTGGGKFDFENTATTTTGYNSTETLTNGNATLIYKARTDVAEYAIEGKGLMLKNTEYIKITFKSGIKQLKFAYKGAFTNTADRKVVVYRGDETSTTVLYEKSFAFNTSEECNLELNETGEFTITIKGGTTRQIVIDNISWTE